MLDLSFEFGFNHPEWHKDAACQEFPEVDWFPERGQSGTPAKEVCTRCLVQSECLSWALDQGTNLLGIWGGASQSERKALITSGKVTGELVRRYGPRAMQGRELERDFASWF